MNIVDPILFQCRYNPAAPAICAPGTELDLVSYGRLEQFIHNIGRRALSSGLMPGQVVAIFVRDKIFHAAIVLGLTRLGIVTLSGRSEPLPLGLRVDAAIADQGYPFLGGLKSSRPIGTGWRATSGSSATKGSGADRMTTSAASFSCPERLGNPRRWH